MYTVIYQPIFRFFLLSAIWIPEQSLGSPWRLEIAVVDFYNWNEIYAQLCAYICARKNVC